MQFASVAVITAGLMSCSPIVDYQGYLPKGEDMQKIQSGMSKTEVEAILGSPSTTATISTSGDSYYYISSTLEQTAFFKPKVTDRQIFAVRFDRDDRVEKFANYGLEDGVIVDFISRETPTRGKELGVLQQLFQNLGRFDPG
jgi:outer membrane protein assembly factor BamE (lipoprotein component of BamABCDE complex)